MRPPKRVHFMTPVLGPQIRPGQWRYISLSRCSWSGKWPQTGVQQLPSERSLERPRLWNASEHSDAARNTDALAQHVHTKAGGPINLTTKARTGRPGTPPKVSRNVFTCGNILISRHVNPFSGNSLVLPVKHESDKSFQKGSRRLSDGL